MKIGSTAVVADEPTYTPEVAERTSSLFERVKHTISAQEWPHFAPYIDEIIRLKQERNAIILAHNYQTRDIYHCVSDVVGDSLALARKAMGTDADAIVMAGVTFMAETAKLMNPDKTVLIPSLEAGCSLADSITAADVRALKEKHPGVPVVTYVNTSVAVKAESDICCTSANAKQVVESLGVDRVFLIPDEYLARNVAAQTDVEILYWAGKCEVHERFDAAQVDHLRRHYPKITVLAHPECPPEVVERADFAGSTSAMVNYVAEHKPEEVALITECSLGDNIMSEHPEVRFVRSCSLCPHMQRITLMNICASLRGMVYEVNIDPVLAERARRAVERMLEVA